MYFDTLLKTSRRDYSDLSSPGLVTQPDESYHILVRNIAHMFERLNSQMMTNPTFSAWTCLWPSGRVRIRPRGHLAGTPVDQVFTTHIPSMKISMRVVKTSSPPELLL
jgi:hypothetical protein